MVGQINHLNDIQEKFMCKNNEIEAGITKLWKIINSGAMTSITTDDVVRISKLAAQEQFVNMHLKSYPTSAIVMKSVASNVENIINHRGLEIVSQKKEIQKFVNTSRSAT